MMKRIGLALTAMLGAVAACSSSDDGTGAVSFSTYGEDYIEKEIPAADVADGWTVRFTTFLVVLGDVSVAESATAAPAARMPKPKIFDVHRPGPKLVFAASGVPARAYPHVSFVIGPQAAAADLGDGVTEAERKRLVDGGYGMLVSGTASKGDVTKRFTWGFRGTTLYDRCEGDLAGKTTPGVLVQNGGTDQAELTIHGDHLFYDDLQAPEAKLRFDNLAGADANADGEITLEELGAVRLATLSPESGPYGTGSAAGVNDLRAYVEALSRTVGHFRGEGECFAAPR